MSLKQPSGPDMANSNIGSCRLCHRVGRDINVQCVLIKEMIIIVDHYTLAVTGRIGYGPCRQESRISTR
jgi:hypothetical protein